MINPVTHRILVKPHDLLEEDDVYRSARKAGLELPGLNREKEAVDTGTVVSFGPTAFRDFGCDNPLKEGDTVVFARYGGKKIKDASGEQFVILNDEDICAIITKDN